MSKELNSKLTESAIDRNWRIETILHVGTMSPDESLPEALERALEDDTLDIALAIGLSRRKALEIDVEALLEHMRHKHAFGLLVNAATPVREYTGDDGTYFSSWGHYSTQWFYGEDLAEIQPKIEAWVEACCESDRKQSGRRAA
ncbi:hypothetical protein KDW40_19185 [Burkholderia cenocepacia]|uniref:Uncharacterized protein n=1 Tax=Burkholderia gladioli (strain BSR3) TaxID=999541 RepID=F2LSC8_BURGS|nr:MULTISPECIES: hypothetical protein [Burkholderia]AEA65724.1 hypothetical protein bgla_3p0230 [Burkholderia gladioli BSR3]MBR8043495.1 hypothetical protein [Burkholderia cenocepacia]MBR8327856.1 hypothetical protein [Burkholderia cenocepacia]